MPDEARPEPQPRMDEQGVPWCNNQKCPHYIQAANGVITCLVTPDEAVWHMCLPAVRQQAEQVEALKQELAEAKEERDAWRELVAIICFEILAKAERLKQELAEGNEAWVKGYEAGHDAGKAEGRREMAEEAAKVVENEPLGYWGEEEHAKLENFAGRCCNAIRRLPAQDQQEDDHSDVFPPEVMKTLAAHVDAVNRARMDPQDPDCTAQQDPDEHEKG